MNSSIETADWKTGDWSLISRREPEQKLIAQVIQRTKDKLINWLNNSYTTGDSLNTHRLYFGEDAYFGQIFRFEVIEHHNDNCIGESYEFGYAFGMKFTTSLFASEDDKATLCQLIYDQFNRKINQEIVEDIENYLNQTLDEPGEND